MKLYMYKGDNPSLLSPEDLVVPPFIFPKSARSVLDADDKVPYIYIFKSVPSQSIIKENSLTQSLVLEGLEENTLLQDLKYMLKDIKLWKVVSLF